MRFGVLTIPNRPWEELVTRWRELEELGFDAIYVADALAHPRDASERWLDAWVCLATLAQVTTRPRIGPLVTSIIFRNPAAVVNAAVSVDRASDGRIELALGAGEPSPDHELAEAPIWPPDERRDRFRAYVERVRVLLDGDPRPSEKPIPFTVAAQSSGTIRVAAEFADAWNTYGGRGLTPPEGRKLVRRRGEELDRRCEEIGRDPGEIRRSILLGAGFIAETPFRSEESLVEVAEAWRALGMNEIVFFHPPGRDVDRNLYERIVREVMPIFR